ncbi:hypothetical protein AB4178_01570 [Vibrio splendidus]
MHVYKDVVIPLLYVLVNLWEKSSNNSPTESLSNANWGTFELESAMGKNSISEAYGHKCVSKFAKLAIHE